MQIKTIGSITELRGKRVFLRADFNVPIKDRAVVDDFRIRAALPTIDFLRNSGARIILASHIEALDGAKATLEPVAAALVRLGVPTAFIKDLGKAPAAVGALKDGDCALLENLRSWDGEKDNDQEFARKLASLADIYVNDAFPVSHREHASIVGVPRYIPGYAGLQVEKEAQNLSRAFDPSHPFLFILGGAKFETKIPLVSRFLSTADRIFIGGAIANDFFRAKGYEVGGSTLSSGDFDLKPLLDEPKISLPPDVVSQAHQQKPPESGISSDIFLDIGPKSVELLRSEIAAASFILWNGTLGYCERGFTEGTDEVARALAEATRKGATSIVGGGDTVAELSAIGLNDAFSFVSTAGGAMLDFLAKGTLPGLEALK